MKRALGPFLAMAALAAVFIAVPPFRKQIVAYQASFRALVKMDTPLYVAKSGAGRGFDTLPDLAQAIANILTREKIQIYWAAPELLGSGQLWQRVVEASWPRIPRKTARAIFRPQGTSHHPACRVVPMPSVNYELSICP